MEVLSKVDVRRGENSASVLVIGPGIAVVQRTPKCDSVPAL